MFTMADIARINAAERPDKTALICDNRSLTYGELNAESCRVANALLDAGVGAQDRVGFIGKNIPEYFTLSSGAAKLNAVPVAVNCGWRRPRWLSFSTMLMQRWCWSKASF